MTEHIRWQKNNVINNSRGLTAPGGKTRNSSTFRGLLAPGYCDICYPRVNGSILPPEGAGGLICPIIAVGDFREKREKAVVDL